MKIPKGQSVSVYRKTDNTMAKKKNVQKEHTYKSKVRVTRIPLKTGVNPGAPEGPADPAPLVVRVVLM